METDRSQIEFARMLIARLERLSVDSWWAHRSSGLRGSLLRALERIDTTQDPEETLKIRKDLEGLIRSGSFILEQAAREIRVDPPRR